MYLDYSYRMFHMIFFLDLWLKQRSVLGLQFIELLVRLSYLCTMTSPQQSLWTLKKFFCGSWGLTHCSKGKLRQLAGLPQGQKPSTKKLQKNEGVFEDKKMIIRIIPRNSQWILLRTGYCFPWINHKSRWKRSRIPGIQVFEVEFHLSDLS